MDISTSLLWNPPFAGWNFDSSGQAVISFKGAVPSAITEALQESPWVDAILLQGGETCSLADLLDHVGGGLHVLGAMDGSGGYDATLRRHVVQVVMDPSRPELTGVTLFDALNDEIVKVGGRELTEWEIEIEEFGPEFLDPSLTLASEEQPPYVSELCGYKGSN